MRSHTVFFTFFVALTLPACQKLEEKAEAKVQAAAEKKISDATLSAMGGTMTRGVCPGWPKTIPVHPNAENTFCQVGDSEKAVESPGFKLWLAAQPQDEQTAQAAAKESPESLAMFMLSYDVDATEDDVDGFYRKNIAGAQPAPPLPTPIPATPYLARKATPADPVTLVLRLRELNPKPSRTHVVILVETLKNF